MRDRARRGGFTLIEVILSIAILALLAGGVFGTVRATMAATAALRDAQQQRQGVYGLIELCQQTFSSLPGEAILVKAVRRDNSAPELTLRQAPRAFAIGERAFFYGETALTARQQNNGGLALGVEYRSINRWTQKVEGDPQWLPLLKDVQSVAWAFYDPGSGIWLDHWENVSRRPQGVRLTLSFLGSEPAWSQTFWLPQIMPVALQSLQSMNLSTNAP
jgi:prepilin-type N-terminal cleavage/methylation domain-containing protein